MEYYYDQRFSCCDTCHHFRDSRIEGRKACNEKGMAFSRFKGITEAKCDLYVTEEQWQAQQHRLELLKKQSKRKKQ